LFESNTPSFPFKTFWLPAEEPALRSQCWLPTEELALRASDLGHPIAVQRRHADNFQCRQLGGGIDDSEVFLGRGIDDSWVSSAAGCSGIVGQPPCYVLWGLQIVEKGVGEQGI
jgi:hypothetical protein